MAGTRPGHRARRRTTVLKKLGVRAVLLYRTPERWRISALTRQGGMLCGGLPDTPPDSSVEAAQAAFRGQLRELWGFDGELTWRQTQPDWWAADVRE